MEISGNVLTRRPYTFLKSVYVIAEWLAVEKLDDHVRKACIELLLFLRSVL